MSNVRCGSKFEPRMITDSKQRLMERTISVYEQHIQHWENVLKDDNLSEYKRAKHTATLLSLKNDVNNLRNRLQS